MKSRLDYIDGLRALAVIAVIIYHLNRRWLPGGFLGVDVFFVISGFIVTHNLYHSTCKAPHRLIIAFYAKRLRRIYPALLFAVLAGSLLTIMLMPQVGATRTRDTALGAILGVSNSVLSNTQDYFSPSSDYNTFTHTWSLGVESQFYLFFPFVFLFIFRCLSFRTALLTLGGISFILMLVGYIPATSFFADNFYSTQLRFWELSAGSLTYFYVCTGRPIPATLAHLKGRSLYRVLARYGVTLSVLCLLWNLSLGTSFQLPFPGSVSAVSATVFCILFMHGQELQCITSRCLQSPIITYVGRLSYSLYLWHWIVFVVMRWTIGLDDISQRVLSIAITILFSLLSYYIFERPFQQRWFESTRIVFPSVTIASAITYFLTIHLFSAESAYSLSANFGNSRFWSPWVHSETLNHCRTEWDNSKLPLYRKLSSSCGVDVSRPSIFVIGDSHAGAYLKMLDRYAVETQSLILLYEIQGCGFLRYDLRERCNLSVERALGDVLKRAKPGDIVFSPGLRLPRFQNRFFADWTDVNKAMLSWQRDETKAYTAAQAVLRRLVGSDLKVVIELPKPIFPTPAFRCSDWFNSANSQCRRGFAVNRGAIEQLRQPVLAFFDSLQKQFPSLILWDPLPLLCPTQKCEMFRDGKPLYFDGDHITGVANDLLYDSFKGVMAKAAR